MSGIVRGVNGQNSIVNQCPCRQPCLADSLALQTALQTAEMRSLLVMVPLFEGRLQTRSMQLKSHLKVNLLLKLRLFIDLCSGGSRISPRRGRQLSGGGRQHTIFAKFSQKLHEIERIWTPRGGMRPKFYYVDPPLPCNIRVFP